MDELLYGPLAPWFHLLTAPEDYAEEATFYGEVLERTARRPVRDVLELGSGGGNNAVHMKRRFSMILSDLSPDMVEVSRRLNPECRHIVADMRTLRLGCSYDAVFVHDAIMYMTTERDLEAAAVTAFTHCRPGGAALFVPDHVADTFVPGVRDGGHDGDGRSLRYLEWTWNPDPGDTTYRVDMAIMLRDGTDGVEVVHDVHRCGLFGIETWLGVLEGAGFEVEEMPSIFGNHLFTGLRPDVA